MVPEAVATTVFLGGLGWVGYAFRQWDGFPEKVEDWLRKRDETQTTGQSARLTSILAFTLPDLTRSYLAIAGPDTETLKRDDLAAVVAEIDSDPTVANVRIREAVTKPTLLGITTKMVDRLPELMSELVFQPAVLDGVDQLGCFAVDVARFRIRAARLILRYQIQVALLVAWVLSIVFAYLSYVPTWTVDASITAGIVPILHGADLEFRRQRLKTDIQSVPGAPA